jgi:uncharacterized membrane protein
VPRDVTCPECRSTLRVPDERADEPVTCPVCLAAVPAAPGGAVRPPRPPSAARQVGRDLTWIDVVCMALGVVLLLGVAVALAVPRPAEGYWDAFEIILVFFLGLEGLATLWIGVRVFRQAARPSPAGTPLVLRLFVGFWVFAGLSFAAVTLLFFTCLAVVAAR